MTSSGSDSVHGEPSTPGEDRRGGLLSRSFLGLLVTQFLGATNDNIIRWLVIGVGKDYVSPEHVADILSGGLICFVVPYLLLAAPAGYLADRFSKRRVIVFCKVAEIAVMSLAVAAVFSQSLYFLFAVLFLMGAQSALFGPSKLGSIPEMLHSSKISAANGVIGLTTVVATVLGAAAGLALYDFTGYRGVEQNQWAPPAVLVGVAVIGWLASLWIKRLPAANPSRRFPFNAPVQSWRDLRTLAADRALLRVALGIAFFWTVGALAQLNIDQFGAEGGLAQNEITPLLVSLVIGVAVGSVLAGVWSGGRVELGILPLGAGGVAVFSMLLFTVQDSLAAAADAPAASLVWACGFLFLLGISAGLFDVPLAAYMQHHSPRRSRGAVLAATNFITFAGILGSAVAFKLLRAPQDGGEPLFTARQIFLLTGLGTIPIFIYIVWLLPQATIRFAAWLASHTVYRIRIFGQDNLPEEGGALLAVNHVSWIDGILLLLTSSRPLRVIAYAPYMDRGWRKWMCDLFGVILIGTGPKSIRQALQTARQALADGQLVAIFPEGNITRTGQLQPFKPGLLSILKETPVPVIPVYLDELWGSIFSFHGGKFFWKRPRRWPYPISIHFGPPVRRADDVHRVRATVAELGVAATRVRRSRAMILPRLFIRACRKARSRTKLSDTLGTTLTGRAVLLRTLILRRLLLREVFSPGEKYIGILLPSTVAGALANAAAALCGRIAVNLNYTLSSDVMNHCVKSCGIRHVLTSRKFMERIDVEVDAELIYLEDFKDRVTLADKLLAMGQTLLLPARLLDRVLGLNRLRGDDVMTVIFTSGSTGRPKGVMLSYDNIGSNVEAIDQVVHLNRDDVLAGIVPFFHSLGYTVTLWAPLALDIGVAYHPNPLEARQVGHLCAEHGVTIMLSTPTFLRNYLKRVPPEQFARLDVVVAGAERLPPELSEAFEKKFGVRPVEGYGTTETAPLVSVNVPPSRSLTREQEDGREGTVGRPVPGVTAKIVDLDSGEELGVGQPGMLLISGPNVMQGYLDQPQQTAEVLRDGWYTTGDVALIDEAGFIKITGRQSRFSKIGGEMVPHLRIEEALQPIVSPDDDEHLRAVVTAVPDEKKGERLVVMHTPLDKTPQEVCDALRAAGLPNLWIPSPDSFCQVDEIPVLGTGKLDLKRMRDLALEQFAGTAKPG